MRLAYDDRRELSILAAEEDDRAVSAALAGKQAAYEAVAADLQLSAVFGPSMDHAKRIVVLKNTADEVTGCCVSLTLYDGKLRLMKEILNASAFQTELLLHKKANNLVKVALLCHSTRHQLLVTELGPRRDMLRELRRLVESDTPPPDVALRLVSWLLELVGLLKHMARDGVAHVDLKWENVSRVVRGTELQRSEEEVLRMVLIDLASCRKHGGKMTRVDLDNVFTTINHAPPELLTGELHPTNDMHAVGHMMQSFIIGLDTCSKLRLPTLHLDAALLAALASGEQVETAWTRRCGLRPNVAAILVLLSSVLVAPPCRQPSWEFVEGLLARMQCMVKNMEAPGQDLRHMQTALELELQLLLQLSSAAADDSLPPIGPKACLPPDMMVVVRERYTAAWEGYVHMKALHEFMQTAWKMELCNPISAEMANDLLLIDPSNQGAMGAHFAPLAPPYALTQEAYDERMEEALWLTTDLLCSDDYDMTALLGILDPAASGEPVLQRLSIAQQCMDGWAGFTVDYLRGYAMPFLPTGSAASSASASSQTADAVTLGVSLLTINATHRGGHALRAAPRHNKCAAAPASLPAQQDSLRQRDRQQRQRQAEAADEEQEGGGGEVESENTPSNLAGAAMPPPPPQFRGAARRGARRGAAARKSCVEVEAASAAAASIQAQQVCAGKQ